VLLLCCDGVGKVRNDVDGTKAPYQECGTTKVTTESNVPMDGLIGGREGELDQTRAATQSDGRFVYRVREVSKWG
jgi:hypothetical protein